LECRCVWRFLTVVLLSSSHLIVCSLKYLHIECHLAAKFGTECDLVGRLCYE
jgi:hypothetical protein